MSGNLFNSVTDSISFSILDTDINEITQNIYIGDKRTAKNHLLLKHLGIKRIVVAGHELTTDQPQQFQYLHISIKDSLKQDISLHFEKVCEFIEKGVINGEGVLVHCAFGISRSPSFVIAYLMKKLKISFRQAFGYVRRKRREINPNINFEQQLKNWECSIKKR